MRYDLTHEHPCEAILSSCTDCQGTRLRCRFNGTLMYEGKLYCKRHHPPSVQLLAERRVGKPTALPMSTDS